MLVLILALACALALTYLAMRGYKTDTAQLRQPRPGPLALGVQIICGDCCGEGERPIKTYIDYNGNCAQCGGHSYMLASHRIVYARQLVEARLGDHKGMAGNSRIA
jgi:hypothetical protein